MILDRANVGSPDHRTPAPVPERDQSVEVVAMVQMVAGFRLGMPLKSASHIVQPPVGAPLTSGRIQPSTGSVIGILSALKCSRNAAIVRASNAVRLCPDTASRGELRELGESVPRRPRERIRRTSERRTTYPLSDPAMPRTTSNSWRKWRPTTHHGGFRTGMKPRTSC